MLFRLNLSHENEGNSVGDVVELGLFSRVIRQDDTEENGRVACPVGAEVVPDAHNGLRQGIGGPLS